MLNTISTIYISKFPRINLTSEGERYIKEKDETVSVEMLGAQYNCYKINSTIPNMDGKAI